jgi:hypothetical protein
MIVEGVDEAAMGDQAKTSQHEQLGLVVHDYDNILTVVSGAIELALRKLARGDIAAAERLLGQGIAATRRGAELSARLTAFGLRCEQTT